MPGAPVTTGLDEGSSQMSSSDRKTVTSAETSGCQKHQAMEKLTLGQTWVGVRGVSQRQQWLPVHATYMRFKCNETAKKEARGINGGKDPAGQDVGRVSVRTELSHSSQEGG